MKERIAQIAHEIETQDNRITAEPLFAVRQRRRIYGLDPEGTDDVVWIDDDADYQEVVDEEEIQQLEQARKDGNEALLNGYHRTGYIDIMEFVTACFTEHGCKEFIRVNGHNLTDPEIYVYSGYRNQEWIDLRKFLRTQGDER